MAAPGILHVFRYDAETLDETRPATLQEARGLARADSTLWINVNGNADRGVIATLEKDFGIHPLTIEDIQHTHQRPKVEEYPGYLYVVTQMIKHDIEGNIETEQVSILLGDGWIITIQEGRPGDVFESVRDRIRQGRPTIRSNGPDYLLYSIVDAIVDAFFPVLEIFSDRAETVEEYVVGQASEDVRSNLQTLRHDLLTLKRVAWPQRDALAVLERSELKWIKPATRTFLRDVSDHATRVIDFVENNRELVASLMDLHIANVAQRTNDVMKVLTVVSTIFIPLTFLVGVYGMNFDYMPELHVWWAYPTLMITMIVLGVSSFMIFRKRGWV